MQHLLLLVIHHIVADGWSLAVLQRELSAYYNAYRRGESVSLPALPLSYAEYARRQRQGLQGAALGRQLEYWRAQLHHAPPLLHLPADRPRLPVQRHRGARISGEISAEVLHALKRLARQERATLFMVLLSAFKVLLMRYSGAEELVVGTPVAGRNSLDVEGLIGFFINTLVLRTALSGNPTFRELLARVKRVAVEAYSNQDVPFEQLVDEISPPRDPAHTPIFQVLFNLHNEPAGALHLQELQATAVALGRQTAKFDLSVSLLEHANGLHIGFEYDTDLFDAATVGELLSGYGRVLQQVGGEPERPIGNLL